MASVIIDIPDAILPDLLEAFAVKYGWTAQSGLTKAQFAKRMLAEHAKSIYQNYMIDKAADAARITAKGQVSNVVIT